MNKLDKIQIEEIEQYLLDWDIHYQDFYEEMLDHFILDIESQMDKGVAFEEAFAQTTHKFAYKSFKPGLFGLGEAYMGPKAYEIEYIQGLQKSAEKRIYKNMLKQLTTGRVLIWPLIVFVLYLYISNKPFSETEENVIVAGFLIYGFLPVFLAYYRGLSPGLAFPWKFRSGNEIDRRKRNLGDKTLVRMVLRTTLGGLVYFNIFNPMVRILAHTSVSEFSWFQYLITIFGILVISYIWGQLELIWELTSTHKENAH